MCYKYTGIINLVFRVMRIDSPVTPLSVLRARFMHAMMCQIFVSLRTAVVVVIFPVDGHESRYTSYDMQPSDDIPSLLYIRVREYYYSKFVSPPRTAVVLYSGVGIIDVRWNTTTR